MEGKRVRGVERMCYMHRTSVEDGFFGDYHVAGGGRGGGLKG